jgi:YVTN family beta-propeller protein
MQRINNKLLPVMVAILCFLLLNGVVMSQGDVIARIPVAYALTVAANPTTGVIYAGAGAPTQDFVAVIDGVTNSVVATIPVGTLPRRFAIIPSSNRIYLPDQNYDRVVVIDGDTNALLTPISVGSVPYGIAANTITNRIYVTELGGHNVDVIDGSTNTVLDVIPMGEQVSEIAVNSTLNRIYVAKDISQEIVVIDGNDNSVITSFDPDGVIDGVVEEMVANEFNNQLYIAIAEPGTFIGDVIQIDGDTNTVVDMIPLPDSPNGLALNSVINHIYVATTNQQASDGKMYTIDGSTNTIADVISIGENIFDVDANPATSRVYGAVDYGSSSVQSTQVYAKIHHSINELKQRNTLPDLFIPFIGMPRAQASGDGHAIAVIQDIRPALIGPKRNYFRMDTPTVTWNRIDWATGYEIQVDNNLDFKSNEYHNDTFNNSVLSVTTGHLDDGIYYWHVRAKRANGTWANWSATQIFEVNA